MLRMFRGRAVSVLGPSPVAPRPEPPQETQACRELTTIRTEPAGP